MKEEFALSSQPLDLTEINENIVKYKVAIASANTIANGFFFSKDLLNTLISTIKGCPVSTYYDEKSDSYAGHEGDIYKSNTGLKRTPMIYPVGFSAYGDNDVFWETLNLDGTDKDWLCAYVYLWKERYPYVEDLTSKVANQSMELDLNYEIRDGVKYVVEATFSGIIIIGITPAFSGSQFLKCSNFSNDVQNLKREFDSYINKQNSNDGGDEINMSKTETDEKPNDEEFSKDDWGSGDYEIKVDKSKDSVSNYAWGDIDKTAQMHKVIKAKNGKTVIDDIYAEVDDGYEDKPSECLKYPVMQVKSDNTAVYNSNALSAALAYANHPDTGNAEVAKKIEGIQKKLGLLKEENESKDDTTKEGEKEKMTKKFKKADKETYAQKFSMTANQIKDAMNDTVSLQTYEAPYGTDSKYYVSDFDDTYMYGYDCENHCSVAIPFTIGEDGTITPNFENIAPAKQISLWIVTDTDGYDDEDDDSDMCLAYSKTQCAKVEKKLNDSKEELSKANDEFSTFKVDAEKKFAEMTSLETALADEKATCADRQKQIDELSAKLKASEDNEKMSKAKELMSKKEFSVFTPDIKENLVKDSISKTYDEFETMAYAELGKFASTHLEYDAENAKFSNIYVPAKTNSVEDKTENVYEETRNKLKNKN